MSPKKSAASVVDVDIWMPLLIDKWNSAVTRLDRADTGSYLQAIIYHWKYGPLPNDLEQVCRIMKIDMGDASSIAQASLKHPFSIALALLKMFFVQAEDGTWTQPTNQRMKSEWQDKRRVFNERAKKAANARWKEKRTKKDASSIPQALLEDMLEECPVSIPVNTPLTSFGGSANAPAPPAKPASDEPKANKQEKRAAGPRSDRNGGGVGNGGKVAAARARTLGLHDKKPHPMLANNPPKPADPRKEQFKAEIFQWYGDMNERDPEHTPWGVTGDRALEAMLDASSIRSIGDLKRCLEHRAVSVQAGEFSSSVTPGTWLRKLPDFLAVPLNRYGDPLPAKRKPLG